MKLSRNQIQHLYWRVGFGILPDELEEINGKDLSSIVKSLLKSSDVYEPLTCEIPEFDGDLKSLSKEERKKLRKVANQKMIELDLNWIDLMSHSKAILREKMTFFFHDHFATRIKNPAQALELNNIIRRNALGDFKKLLSEVSKSPAMIHFLNNKQNKKSSPNENFAREVLELFTLGRDNGYTELDIKEAARAFTGWTTNKGLQFTFNQKVHDSGSKTFLGQIGNFDGNDILNIITQQEQTALYITEKLCKFLVGDEFSKKNARQISKEFYRSNYNLSILVETILLHNDFFASHNIGTRIKTPTELIVGMNRLFDIEYKSPKAVLQIQRKLNQVLFFPPDVSGWQEGREWIDSSTLMFRMKLPSLLLNFGIIEWRDDSELSENMVIKIKKVKSKVQEQVKKKVQAYPNWECFNQVISSQEERLTEFLLQGEISSGAQKMIAETNDQDTKYRVIAIMSTPEYQLC